MAIIERELPISRQWEVKATGEDIPKLSGMLTKTGNEAYRKAFHKNEGIGFERVSDPRGMETWIRRDQVEEYEKQGYGRLPSGPSFLVPDLPWLSGHKRGVGRRRFKFVAGEFVEV